MKLIIDGKVKSNGSYGACLDAMMASGLDLMRAEVVEIKLEKHGHIRFSDNGMEVSLAGSIADIRKEFPADNDCSQMGQTFNKMIRATLPIRVTGECRIELENGTCDYYWGTCKCHMINEELTLKAVMMAGVFT